MAPTDHLQRSLVSTCFVAALLFVAACTRVPAPCDGAIVVPCDDVAGRWVGTFETLEGAAVGETGTFVVSVDDETCAVSGGLAFSAVTADLNGGLCAANSAALFFAGAFGSGAGELLFEPGRVSGSFDITVGENMADLPPGRYAGVLEGEPLIIVELQTSCAIACDDHNPCTDDLCDENYACIYIENNVFCDDGNACTSNEFCDGGFCGAGISVGCDDNNTCTETGCQPSTGLCRLLEVHPLCCGNGLCEAPETCMTCPGDCICCGNAVCEMSEDCNTCPTDCDSLLTGTATDRYCCGNGTAEQAEGDGTICDGNF